MPPNIPERSHVKYYARKGSKWDPCGQKIKSIKHKIKTENQETQNQVTQDDTESSEENYENTRNQVEQDDTEPEINENIEHKLELDKFVEPLYYKNLTYKLNSHSTEYKANIRCIDNFIEFKKQIPNEIQHHYIDKIGAASWNTLALMHKTM